MTYKIRVISKKQELKKPDEFVSTVDRLAQLARTRTKLILVVVGLLVMIGSAIGGLVWYQIRQEETAAALEFKAASYYHQPVLPVSEGEGGLKSARDENLKKAIELYQEVVTRYPRAKSAALSQYYLGNSYLELGDYDQAVAAYQTFVERHQDSPLLIGLVRQRLGYAYLAKGDLRAAQGAFEGVLEIDEALNKDQVLFEIGRLHETQGKNEGAIQQYRKIVKDYPDSLLTPEAQARLRGLGVAETEPALPEIPKGAPSTQSENPSEESPSEAFQGGKEE